MSRSTPEHLIFPGEHSAADAASHLLLKEDVAPESLSRLQRHAQRAPEAEQQVILALLCELDSQTLRAVDRSASRSHCHAFSALTELGNGKSGVLSAELVSDGRGPWTVIRVHFVDAHGIPTDVHMLTIPRLSHSTAAA